MYAKWIFAIIISGSVTAKLTSEEESEGPCNPNIERYLAKNVNLSQLGMTKDYYVPMGSQAMYRHYAEVFLGRSLANHTELAEMQLRIKYSEGKIASNRAFPKRDNPPYFSQNCSPNDVGAMSVQVVCRPICKSGSSSANLKDPGIRSTLDTIAYWYSTENDITFLVVRCPSDGIQDYKILSTNKSILEPTRTRILYKIREIGFDITKLYYMHYD